MQEDLPNLEGIESILVTPAPSPLIDPFQQNAIRIADIQATCSTNLRSTANIMAQQHIHKLGEAKVGDTVQVPVPEVDRGPADCLHILAYITQVNQAHATYQLATKHGIIRGMHARNAFHICKQKLISFDHLDLTKELSLREINGHESLAGKQGFSKCNCSGKCERNCSCKKAGVTCNSKCHKNKNNTACTNNKTA